VGLYHCILCIPGVNSGKFEINVKSELWQLSTTFQRLCGVCSYYLRLAINVVRELCIVFEEYLNKLNLL
jgi:hypothetical protein